MKILVLTISNLKKAACVVGERREYRLRKSGFLF